MTHVSDTIQEDRTKWIKEKQKLGTENSTAHVSKHIRPYAAAVLQQDAALYYNYNIIVEFIDIRSCWIILKATLDTCYVMGTELFLFVCFFWICCVVVSYIGFQTKINGKNKPRYFVL